MRQRRVRDGRAPFLHEVAAPATSIGGGQPRMIFCSDFIGASPSTGSCMPMAMKLGPAQVSRQNSSACRPRRAPGAFSPSGTRFGNARSAAL
ncbi:MAG: hypothetical protein U1F50_11900 [Rubrivivax sp.]